jgi:hypothetical protein
VFKKVACPRLSIDWGAAGVVCPVDHDTVSAPPAGDSTAPGPGEEAAAAGLCLSGQRTGGLRVRPILTPYELEVLLGEAAWKGSDDEAYPMDYYRCLLLATRDTAPLEAPRANLHCFHSQPSSASLSPPYALPRVWQQRRRAVGEHAPHAQAVTRGTRKVAARYMRRGPVSKRRVESERRRANRHSTVHG